ncbi:MAG: UvrD-helicase domain-containing protein [Bacteroidia bacterium]|jgi:ATP-dependent exoDNAse (exonuclease V) beta subunit|nr:UvrD-helicase domain-containing protein [Bacteroidia bacterium]
MSNFVVYKSGAGSGKTFTLVKEYLRLCLCDKTKLNSNYRRILAVTFTNKAAAEMKSRIIENLHRISLGEMKGTGELLCAELGIGEEDIQGRSSVVLKELLHHYADFSVSTIDSFTHRLVKTFAHDLKLPVNFEVELDEDRFFYEVVRELISRTGEDPYISKLLKEYVLLRSEENTAWDPELLIQNFSKLLHKENSGPFVELLNSLDEEQLKTSKTQIREQISTFYSHTSDLATKAIMAIDKSGYTTDDFHFKSSGAQNFFYKVQAKTIELKDANSSRLSEAIQKNKWFSVSPDNDNKKKELALLLSRLAQELVAYILSEYKLFSLCRMIDKQLYPLLLLKKIEEISRERKEEARVVFISEFNRKLFELIQNEPTPFIYERLGERYRHFLLDEFQDTSSLQWQNMLPLIDNSLASGGYNLLVGDGKQSIYRWRNANIKQFTRLPYTEYEAENWVMQEREANLIRNFEEKQLDKNFRSLQTIVEFNNSVFHHLSSQLLNETSIKIYEKSAQLNMGGAGGYVSVFTFDSKLEDTDQANFTHVLLQIHSSLEQGFSLSDICVLCKTNQNGHSIAHFLMLHNIPVVSSDSLLLTYIPEVQVLLSFFRYLLNPEDKISAGLVINYLFQIGTLQEDECHASLQSVSQNANLFVLLNRFGFKLNETHLFRSNLFDLAAELSHVLQLNIKAGLAIRFFLDEINHFLQKGNSNLSEFLNWWEIRQKKASLIISQNTNAVNVMTIHASKGLEFPVVIIPYCHWKVDQFRENWVLIHEKKIDLPLAVVTLSDKAIDAGFEKEVSEEKQAMALDNLNLLYVAFTRAVERLHIICQNKGNTGNTVNAWLLSALPENMKEKTTGFYECGRIEPKQHKEKKTTKATYPLAPLTFSNKKVQFSVKPAYLHNSKEENARTQGILLHWILSQINTALDLEEALRRGELKGYYGKTQIPELKDMLKNILNHPQLKLCFSEGVSSKNEAELLTEQGLILRPDRIVFLDKETVVLDYKSGKEHTKQHAAQVQAYAEALQNLGFKTIRKLLVYLEENRVVELN